MCFPAGRISCIPVGKSVFTARSISTFTSRFPASNVAISASVTAAFAVNVTLSKPSTSVVSPSRPFNRYASPRRRGASPAATTDAAPTGMETTVPPRPPGARAIICSDATNPLPSTTASNAAGVEGIVMMFFVSTLSPSVECNNEFAASARPDGNITMPSNPHKNAATVLLCRREGIAVITANQRAARTSRGRE